MKTTRMTKIVTATATNPLGVLFGGQLMYWMDEVSAIAACRFADDYAVTAGVDQIRFLKPVPMGAFIELISEIVSVGNTSMKVKVTVYMDRKGDQEPILVADAMFTYVAVDQDGKPKRIEKSL